MNTRDDDYARSLRHLNNSLQSPHLQRRLFPVKQEVRETEGGLLPQVARLDRLEEEVLEEMTIL